MNVSCPHCHRYFPVAGFTPGGVTGCPHCLRNVFLPNEEVPDAFLIPLEGEAANNRIPLSSRMVIGRSNECDIQVLDSNISRQHAEIVYEGGKFVVRDLGSRNGVIVNEARVGEAPVRHMDVIRMGGRNFRFEMGAGRGPAPAVAVPTLPPPPPPEHAAPPASVFELDDVRVPRTTPGASSTVPQRGDPMPVTNMGARDRSGSNAPAKSAAEKAVLPDAGSRPVAVPTAQPGDSLLGNLSMFVPPPGAAALLRADPAGIAASAAMDAAQAASAPRMPSASAATSAGHASTASTDAGSISGSFALGSELDLPPVAEFDSASSMVRSTLSADDVDQIVAQVGEGAAARAAACLQTVYRVSEALVGVLDIDQICRALLEQVLSAVPADRAYVILKNDAGEFAVRAAQFREDRHAENQMMVSRTMLKRVVEEHVSVLVADAQVDMQAAHSIVSQGIRSVMCVPLAIGKSGFGAISVDTLRSRNAFDDSDLKMLTAIARQASIALENLRLLHQVEENARTRGILERYLPPELIEQVVQRKVDLKPGGQLTELTILFSDIRGFTQLAKGMHPEAVVELINEYFGIMVEVLFQFGATLDKYIGDSIMAFWGAPVKHPDDPQRAVRCALEMQNKLAQFNQLMKSSGQQELAVGIGINTGEAVVGNIGSVRRYEYTVLGDAVNVASRLQGMAKGGQVLITEATHQKLGNEFKTEAHEPVELKGRSGLVGVYSVLG